MSMGTPWETSTPASVSRKNKTSVITMSGDELELLDKTKFKIVTCNADGGQFLNHHTYYFGDDGSTVVDLTQIQAHTHTDSEDGGSITRIHMDTPEHIDLQLIKPTDIDDTIWMKTTTGSATISTTAASGTTAEYIRLQTGATSGSGATIKWPGPLNLDFSSPSIFVAVGLIETATSIAANIGVNTDDVTAANSNTIKYHAEFCTATNNNWWLRTADGSANSAGDTGHAINTSNQSIKIIHDPLAGTPYARLEIDATDSFMKTTNIPVTGQSTGNNLIKFSVKNSTAADRPYRVRGCRLSFVTGSSWAYGGVNE